MNSKTRNSKKIHSTEKFFSYHLKIHYSRTKANVTANLFFVFKGKVGLRKNSFKQKISRFVIAYKTHKLKQN